MQHAERSGWCRRSDFNVDTCLVVLLLVHNEHQHPLNNGWIQREGNRRHLIFHRDVQPEHSPLCHSTEEFKARSAAPPPKHKPKFRILIHVLFSKSRLKINFLKLAGYPLPFSNSPFFPFFLHVGFACVSYTVLLYTASPLYTNFLNGGARSVQLAGRSPAICRHRQINEDYLSYVCIIMGTLHPT